MQIFYDKIQGLTVEPTDSIQHVKDLIEVRCGLPACAQRLIYGGRQLDEEQTVAGAGLEAGSTINLVLRLRGGKGGFGSLLRSAGRAALTDNFDACRDLSGRRMRHVNADKKLADWAAHAKERELQKAAAKNLREQERAAQQEVEQQVDMDNVKVAQDAALANVLSAVESALASAPLKRKPEAGQPGMLPAKRQKASGHMLGLDADLSSDSEEEQDDVSNADVNVAGTAPAYDSKADTPGKIAKGMGPVKEIVAETVRHSALEANVPGGSSSPDSEQEALHSLVEPAQPPHGSSSVLETTPVPQATNLSQALEAKQWEPVDLSKYKSAQELEDIGLEHLKGELQRLGLKSGGSLTERAARLFLLSSTPLEKIDRKHLAKPAKK